MSVNIWVLTKTTTPKTEDDEERSVWHAESESWEYSDFAEARDAFRRLARECAMCESDVFDGDGNIRKLQWLFGRIQAWLEAKGPYDDGRQIWEMLREVPDYSFMTGDFESAKMLPSALRDWLLDMGAYEGNPLPEFKWTDWGFGIVSKSDSIAMGLIHEYDRIEHSDAQVYTNAFDMNDPEGDYEFSVRTQFDCYDMDAGALRIRLARGSAEGGRYVWPEEAENWLDAIHDEPAPCLEGEIDGSGSVFARVKACGEGGWRYESLCDGYASFIEGIIGVAKSRGLSVDERFWMPKDSGVWGHTRIDCFYSGDEGAWFRFTVCVDFDPRTQEQIEASLEKAHAKFISDGKLTREQVESVKRRRLKEPAVKVAQVPCEGYPQALERIASLMDEHIALMRRDQEIGSQKSSRGSRE